jgi:hypothetical protein
VKSHFPAGGSQVAQTEIRAARSGLGHDHSDRTPVRRRSRSGGRSLSGQ